MVGENQEANNTLAQQTLGIICQTVQNWLQENLSTPPQVQVIAEQDDTSTPVIDNLYVAQSHLVERPFVDLPVEEQRNRYEGIHDAVFDVLDKLRTVEKKQSHTSNFYIFADQSAVAVGNDRFRSNQSQLIPLVQAFSWKQPLLQVGDEQMPTNFNLHRLGYQMTAFANETTIYKHLDETMPLLAHSRTGDGQHLTVFNLSQPPVVVSVPQIGQGRGQLVHLREPECTNSQALNQEPIPVNRIEGVKTRYPALLLNQVASQFGVQLTGDNAKRLLKGQKTDVVITGDGSTGKLYVLNTPDTGPQLVLQDVRRELTLKDSYLGHVFTDKDKQNLTKYGDMGRAVDLIDKQSGQKFTGFIGVDKDTKTLTVLRADQIRPKIERMSHLKGIPLNGLQKQRLMEGKAIRLDNMTSKAGTSFSAYVRVSAAGRNLRFDHIPTGQSQKATTAQSGDKLATSAFDEVKPAKLKRAAKPKP